MQEVGVSSHGTTSCTPAAMQMAQSALRSEGQASAPQPGFRHNPTYRGTSRPASHGLAPAVLTSAADVGCHFAAAGAGIGPAVGDTGVKPPGCLWVQRLLS